MLQGSYMFYLGSTYAASVLSIQVNADGLISTVGMFYVSDGVVQMADLFL